ncbi:hypothetical protein PILCRDRAFT_812559 [Piloderma croceum F 1598]|uniref:Uncharacterized protein n=1 Tax=Piloderma croceum (strain F 1598) TaxID=765440 RepID=A0A0C3G0M0_PILCF|nr:hypothetical protein PILCRDRAFT_812559 [Piloderma croceum F 1598]
MPSLRRLFHPSGSSPSVGDDLADLEESFRNSFALVPSALTPSRAPSNSLIATTRALFFNRPVRLDFTSGHDQKDPAPKELPTPVLPRIYYHIH